MGLALVRPPLMRWYKSQGFLIFGSSIVDILLKQVSYRVGFELFIFALACVVGSLGGSIIVLLRLINRKPAATPEPRGQEE